MTFRRERIALLLVLAASAPARADGPGDNLAESVRRIPGPGIKVGADDRRELEDGLGLLGNKLGELESRPDPRTTPLLPDARVFYKAVHDALTHDEFFTPKDVARARDLIAEGNRRVQQLA